MKRSAIFIPFGLFVLLCCSCREKSTNPDTPSAIAFSSQSSKCLSTGLAKSSGLDSLFIYSFTGNLIVDFSVSANCCPDSNRFEVTHIVHNDTIIISVADTAGNNCRCLCPYMIHVEFENLAKDQYVVQCRMGSSSNALSQIHLVNVNRKK